MRQSTSERRGRPITVVAALFCLLWSTAGCVQNASQGFSPIDPDHIMFWDRQTTETGVLLREIIDEFNAGRESMPVKAEYSGDYSVIFQKVRASIQMGAVPDMAVAYESMTSEYVRDGAAVALDGFLADPEIGLGSEELADFFPAVIETNQFPEFGGKMYSFPFCKSVLMMYFNKRVLAEAGISAPPATWDEFLDHCRRIKRETGKYAYAISVDASTVDGMIYSMGADVVSGRQTLFDSPEALNVFRLFETLAKERLAYQIQQGTFDDKVALAQDQVAFVFRSSSHRTSMAALMEGQLDSWGMALIPQARPEQPCTVLYGPNICVFDTGPERSRIAWQFVRFFTSRDNNVRWALGTGYVPIRKSAGNDPRMEAFWSEWEYNRAAFDCLPFARSEPNVAGWQEVRSLVEKAETSILAGLQSGENAARELKRSADAVLDASAPRPNAS